MSKEARLAIMKNRYQILSENGKNIKSPGVIRALAREIRNLEKEI